MAETYSQSVTGLSAGSPFSVANITIGDSACQTQDSQRQAMRNGTQILCKMADGSKKWMTIDPTRWVPGQSPYLLAV